MRSLFPVNSIIIILTYPFQNPLVSVIKSCLMQLRRSIGNAAALLVAVRMIIDTPDS